MIKEHYLRDLRDGDLIQEPFALREAWVTLSKKEKLFAKLVVADRTGDMEVVKFGGEYQLREEVAECKAAPYVVVSGQVQEFNGRISIKAQEITPLYEVDCQDDFLAASPRLFEIMTAELDSAIARVTHPTLQALLSLTLLETETLRATFLRVPAARHRHHAYLHGLLEHTLEVVDFVESDIEHYKYLHFPIFADLLRAGAILHDIGKTREMELDGVTWEMTEDGHARYHLNIGAQIIANAMRHLPVSLRNERLSIQLQHLVYSHHGKKEWGSNPEPASVEANLLHLADMKSASICYLRDALASADPDAIYAPVPSEPGRYVFTRMHELYEEQGNEVD